MVILEKEVLQTEPYKVLRLAAVEHRDDRLGDYLRPDDLDATSLRGVIVTFHNEYLDWRATEARGMVVEVEEITNNPPSASAA